MTTSPQPEFRSEQYEFSAEHNRTLNSLAGSMSVVANLMKMTGFVFLVIGGLLLYQAIQVQGGYGPVIALGVATLLCLCIGFWTSSAAHSFRRIVESKNQDVWHLMNALGSLHGMYSLMRTLILGSLVLLVVGLGLLLFSLVRQ